MKRILFIVVIILLAGSALTSCDGGKNNFPEQQKTLDSLSHALDQSVNSYKKYDLDSLINIKKTVDENLKVIGSIYTQRQDTMTFNQALMVGNYKSNAKVFKNLKNRHASNLKEISIAKKQLNSLKTDIKSGGISDAKLLDTYISKEKKSVSELITNLDGSRGKFDTGLKTFYNLQPKVVHLLDSLKNGNNN